MKEKIKVLKSMSVEFGEIAKKVNESSLKRKLHSKQALKYINTSFKIGSGLIHEIGKVADSDKKHRDQSSALLNICRILSTNIKNQNNVIQKLISKNSFSEKVCESLIEKNKNLSSYIEEAKENLQRIIKGYNKLVFMDEIILMYKSNQIEAIKKLEKLTSMSLRDAENAIVGSSENLERGLDFVKKFDDIESVICNENFSELKELEHEAHSGGQTASIVNESSKSQSLFAGSVKKFTEELHRDSLRIRGLIAAKHNIFEENLQFITVLTVVLSLKFKKYTDVQGIIEDLDYSDNLRDQMNELNVYIKTACFDIKTIAEMNYDMADTSHLHNELEDKTVDIAEKEIACYNTICREIEKMTEATAYPVQGSASNMENAYILETNIKEIISLIQN